MQPKTALITGITGQDGSYLAELLLSKKYEVYGLVFDQDNHFENIDSFKGKINLIYGNITDYSLITNTIKELHPDEIYNLASQSHVGRSWSEPVLTFDQTATSAINIFEAVHLHSPKSKIFQASSSEILNPKNPYAIAKLAAHQFADIYRQSYQLFISTGILFNHESPRRRPDIVTRKISLAVARIKNQIDHNIAPEKLELGNLDTARDWGFAPDYVQAMWQTLQTKTPDAFTIATGEIHSLKEFCELAFNCVNLNWQDYVVINPKFFRPIDTPPVAGDYSKIKKVTGWQPTTTFSELVKIMVKSDLITNTI